MREFLLRLVYLLVVLGLYLLGLKLSSIPAVKASFPEVDLKIVLPLVSLVFLDFYIRKFSPVFFRVRLKEHRVDGGRRVLTFHLFHRSSEPIHYEFQRLSGVRCERLTLSCRKSADRTYEEFTVPESFGLILNKDDSHAVLLLTAVPGTFLRPVVPFRNPSNARIFVLSMTLRANELSLTHWFFVRAARQKGANS